MPLPEQFQRVEDEYYRLKGKYAAGRLTEVEFDHALKDLMIQDAQGRYWMVGANTGEWYVNQGDPGRRASPLKLQRLPSRPHRPFYLSPLPGKARPQKAQPLRLLRQRRVTTGDSGGA